MATISQLLNPIPEVKGIDSDVESTAKGSYHDTDDSSDYGSRRKPKLCKDAAVFTRGPLHGECRYPPHETEDNFLSTKHEEFHLYPAGRIALYPRHIPYSSGKKLFYDKTGRESLEVFQYEFKVPGSDTTYAMLWDYNIGLVRTTPLFKCTGHSKTTPAKMLNRNVGLREICHSITGGALVAQGYWMPYEAAKAIACTFCWRIRYALTPVFGTDFPGLCLPPDHPKHGSMTIDQAITEQCTRQALLYREMETGQSTPDSTATPETSVFPINKTMITRQARTSKTNYNSDTSIDSIETISSPAVSHHNGWISVNTPRSVPGSAISPRISGKRKLDDLVELPSRAISPSDMSTVADDGYEGDNSSIENTAEQIPVSCRTTEELQAAYTLYSLSFTSNQGAIRTGKRQRCASI